MEGGAATKSYRYWWAEPPFESATRRETAADRRAQLAMERDPAEVAAGLMDFSTRAKAEKAWRERNPFESRARTELGKAGKRLETAAGNAAERVARRAAPAVAAAAPTIAAAAATGAGLIAAGAISYFLTRYSTEGARLGREAKVQLVNQLYRDAVSKMRTQLGRQPTAQEIRPLSEEWRRRLADAEANVPTMLRPGRE